MILAKLSGPHVPRFVSAGDVRASPYVAMEWIDGESFAEVIARAPLPPEDVARVGAALADAVHSIHLQDVIHFDIKMENFLLRPTGEAVVLDFGFAPHARCPICLPKKRTSPRARRPTFRRNSCSMTGAIPAAISSR